MSYWFGTYGTFAGFLLLVLLFRHELATGLMTVYRWISDRDQVEQFVAAFSRGIDDYLIKPVNLDLLWIKLQKSCQSYQLAQLNLQQQLQLETSSTLDCTIPLIINSFEVSPIVSRTVSPGVTASNESKISPNCCAYSSM